MIHSKYYAHQLVFIVFYDVKIPVDLTQMILVCITDSEVIMYYLSASKKKLWRI